MDLHARKLRRKNGTITDARSGQSMRRQPRLLTWMFPKWVGIWSSSSGIPVSNKELAEQGYSRDQLPFGWGAVPRQIPHRPHRCPQNITLPPRKWWGGSHKTLAYRAANQIVPAGADVPPHWGQRYPQTRPST